MSTIGIVHFYQAKIFLTSSRRDLSADVSVLQCSLLDTPSPPLKRHTKVATSNTSTSASINTTISPLVCCHLEVSSGRWHWMWRGRMRQKEDVLCVCTPWHSFCVPFECSNSNNTRQSTLYPSPPHRSASISIAIASIRRRHHRIVIQLSLSTASTTTSPAALHREHHVVIDITIHRN